MNLLQNIAQQASEFGLGVLGEEWVVGKIGGCVISWLPVPAHPKMTRPHLSVLEAATPRRYPTMSSVVSIAIR
jgi:hypothetical protein